MKTTLESGPNFTVKNTENSHNLHQNLPNIEDFSNKFLFYTVVAS